MAGGKIKTEGRATLAHPKSAAVGRQTNGAEQFGPNHVKILMALYNGAAWLPDQLYSLLRQTHADWSLSVGDDGSTDDGAEIIDCFARSNPDRDIALHKGPGRGFAPNFLNLIREAEADTPFVAFADQDDSWLPEKLERGLARLAEAGDEPALYCGRTWICSRRLHRLRQSKRFRHEPCFKNAIVQSIGGGNTMILNNAAFKLVKQSISDVEDVASHDWWAYQVVSGAGGRIIYDQEPMVLYRQHGTNVIGAGEGLGALVRRFLLVITGTFQGWNEVNLQALRNAQVELSQESRNIMHTFENARQASFFQRLSLLNKSGVYHQTQLGNLGFWFAALVRKI
jgi:glycosyltransferase involved in cell wall biosynthesis